MTCPSDVYYSTSAINRMRAEMYGIGAQAATADGEMHITIGMIERLQAQLNTILTGPGDGMTPFLVHSMERLISELHSQKRTLILRRDNNLYKYLEYHELITYRSRANSSRIEERTPRRLQNQRR